MPKCRIETEFQPKTGTEAVFGTTEPEYTNGILAH